MKLRGTTSFIACVAALAIAGSGALCPAHAEIGVTLGATPGSGVAVTGLHVLSIVDDGDPFGRVWHRYTNDPSRIALNANGEANGDGDPALVLNPVSALPIVVWSRNSASGYDVVVSVFASGAWTVPVVVAGSPADELDPDVFLDAAGNVHLVYWINDGATRTVVHRQAPPDVSSWNAPVTVSAPGEAGCRPSGVVHDGVVRVAYEVHVLGFGSVPRNVVLARLENGAFVPEVVAVTNNDLDVRPEVHSHSGRLWIDWIDAHGATEFDGEMAWMRLGAGGQWESSRYEPFPDREQRDLLLRPAIRLKALAP